MRGFVAGLGVVVVRCLYGRQHDRLLTADNTGGVTVNSFHRGSVYLDVGSRNANHGSFDHHDTHGRDYYDGRHYSDGDHDDA